MFYFKALKKLAKLPLPIPAQWNEFKKRPIGLGLTTEERNSLCFKILRHYMLKNFIPCSGINVKEGLLEILKKQTKNYPIPTW
jgi:Mlc titration factor MtfA (ptsG expression regulator)